MLMLSVLMLMQLPSAPPPIVSLGTQVRCEGRSDPVCVTAVARARAIIERRDAAFLNTVENGTAVQLTGDKGIIQLGQDSAAARALLDAIKARAEPPRSFVCGVYLQQPVSQCYLFVGEGQGMDALSLVLTAVQGSSPSLTAVILPREFAVGAPVPCNGSELQICRTFENFGHALASLDASALTQQGSSETTVEANGPNSPFPHPHFPNTLAGWRSALASVEPPSAGSTTTCYVGRRLNTQAADTDTGVCRLAISGTDAAWLVSLIKLHRGKIVEVSLLRMSDAKPVVQH